MSEKISLDSSVFSDKNRYLCAQGKQLLYYESYRRRLVFA